MFLLTGRESTEDLIASFTKKYVQDRRVLNQLGNRAIEGDLKAESFLSTVASSSSNSEQARLARIFLKKIGVKAYLKNS